MSRLLCTAVLLVAASSAAGCVFYADADDDDICAYDTDEPAYEVRNPETGECEYYGGGGGCYGAPEAYPDWASCYSGCEDLDEASCLGTPACRAAYADSVWDDCTPDGDCGGDRAFLGCWGTAPSGPVQGECWNLDAHECSRHDDCAAVYTRGEDASTDYYFTSCEPEPWSQGCYGDDECPAGYECTADTECMPPPGCDPDTGEDCPDVCYGRCVPSQNGCEGVDCGPGYHCEMVCYGGCDDPDSDGNCETTCEVTCVPDANTCEDGELCPPGTHCETRCEDCPDGEVCPEYCWSECVPDYPTTCENVDCAPGYHCEEQCWCPPCDDADPSCGEPCSCGPVCVPDGTNDPGECWGDVWCDSLPPECPEGTTPGIVDGCWSGFCIPLEDCEPNDPGSCDGEVFCDMEPPACPEGTTPGILDGCYTGYCIPLWACGTDQSCESLQTERECVSRADCEAVYDGWGCTCDPDGTCSCEEVIYSHCVTGDVTDPPEPEPLPGDQ